MAVCEITVDSGNFKPIQGDANYNLKTREMLREGHSIVQLTADGNIKGSAGTLYMLAISLDGGAAGNSVVIKDGGAGGTERFRWVAAAADENFTVNFYAAAFGTDIFLDVTHGGNIYVTAVYD